MVTFVNKENDLDSLFMSTLFDIWDVDNALQADEKIDPRHMSVRLRAVKEQKNWFDAFTESNVVLIESEPMRVEYNLVWERDISKYLDPSLIFLIELYKAIYPQIKIIRLNKIMNYSPVIKHILENRDLIKEMSLDLLNETIAVYKEKAKMLLDEAVKTT